MDWQGCCGSQKAEQNRQFSEEFSQKFQVRAGQSWDAFDACKDEKNYFYSELWDWITCLNYSNENEQKRSYDMLTTTLPIITGYAMEQSARFVRNWRHLGV